MSASGTQSTSPFRGKRTMNRKIDLLFTAVSWIVGAGAVLFIFGLLFLILEEGLPQLR